jgi:glycerol uptake facilitator-like aquaporin
MMVSTILHINASTGYQGNQCNGLVVGLALMGGLLITDVLGGGLLNPAAVLGLSVSNVAFEKHARRGLAVFIVAPFVGAILGNLTVMVTSPPDIGKK